jgi:hypothetical protein
VDKIVESASTAGGQSRTAKLKRGALEEGKQFLGIFIYLTVVFGMFVLHEWLVLTKEHINYRFYGIAFINALILAKIFLLAEHFHFAEQFKDKPLLIPILYKSAAFTALLMVAYIVEDSVMGLFHHESLRDAFPKVGNGSIEGWFFVTLIMTVALIPFFAYRELDRALGGSRLRDLIFGRGPNS